MQKSGGITPTLSRSFVVAPFQLGLVWLSVLSTLLPNPSVCPRVGVWDNPGANSRTISKPQARSFVFVPGTKREGFEVRNRSKGMPERLLPLFGACLAKRIVASGFTVLRSRRSGGMCKSDGRKNRRRRLIHPRVRRFHFQMHGEMRMTSMRPRTRPLRRRRLRRAETGRYESRHRLARGCSLSCCPARPACISVPRQRSLVERRRFSHLRQLA